MRKRSRSSIEKGVGFGVTSGVITTLGMMVGLDAGTNSSLAVMVGVFSIAIADSLSDAMGMHTAEETTNNTPKYALWETTFATFLSKFIFTLTFVIPIFLFDLSTAIIVSILWGMFVIGLFSYYVATKQKREPGPLMTTHLAMTVLVIIITYFVGKFIGYITGIV